MIETYNGYIYIDHTKIDDKEKMDYIRGPLGGRIAKHPKTQKMRYRVLDTDISRTFLDIRLPNKGKKITRTEVEERYPYLYDYQVEDVVKMVNLGKMLNANTMGLGKSLETIVTLDILQAEKILVVAPKSVKSVWKNEIIKWTDTSEEDICIVDGNIKQREKQTKNNKKYTIVNYEQLRNPRNKDYLNLTKIKWDAIVLDEAHRIKNRKAKQTTGVKRLKAKYRFALTGTPITNKVDDLYSILHFVEDRSVGNSYWRFVELFCHVERSFFGEDIVGLTKIERHKYNLEKITDRYMIRRTNEASLPDVIRSEIYLDMSKKHRKIYKEVNNKILVELENEEVMFINSVLTRFLRLQQLTSNTEKFGMKENIKFEYIKDLLKDNEQEKFVIFSRFKETVDALEKYLNVPVIKITGDTEDKDLAVKQFVNGKTQALIATIGSIGEGVDGLQHASSNIVFIDKDWSPAKNEQAIGRLARTGQTEKVKVHSLYLRNTIDEHVENLLNTKTEEAIKILKN